MENHNTTISSQTKVRNPALKWFGVCLGAVALSFIAVSVFKVSVGNLFVVGVLLACPLMHLWMMKDGGHKH